MIIKQTFPIQKQKNNKLQSRAQSSKTDKKVKKEHANVASTMGRLIMNMPKDDSNTGHLRIL